jgi:hypothetical protein
VEVKEEERKESILKRENRLGREDQELELDGDVDN